MSDVFSTPDPRVLESAQAMLVGRFIGGFSKQGGMIGVSFEKSGDASVVTLQLNCAISIIEGGAKRGLSDRECILSLFENQYQTVSSLTMNSEFQPTIELENGVAYIIDDEDSASSEISWDLKDPGTGRMVYRVFGGSVYSTPFSENTF